MNTPIICPLATNGFKPIEALTAEECRKSEKAFPDLPYTPYEAQRAAKLSELISKTAQLGFGEVIFDASISPQMKSTLEKRGFRVTEFFNPKLETPLFAFHVHIYGKKIESKFLIQWNLELPITTPSQCYASREDAQKELDERVKKFEQLNKAREDDRKETDEAIQEIRQMQPPVSSGCFPLIIAAMVCAEVLRHII